MIIHNHNVIIMQRIVSYLLVSPNFVVHLYVDEWIASRVQNVQHV